MKTHLGDSINVQLSPIQMGFQQSTYPSKFQRVVEKIFRSTRSTFFFKSFIKSPLPCPREGFHIKLIKEKIHITIKNYSLGFHNTPLAIKPLSPSFNLPHNPCQKLLSGRHLELKNHFGEAPSLHVSTLTEVIFIG